MTEFAPLTWVTGTLTIWHFVAWAAFFALCIWPPEDPSKRMPWPLRLWGGVVILPVIYCWMGPVVGQIFGDKFDWAQLWPTGFALSGTFSTLALVFGLSAAWSEKSAGVALFFFLGATLVTLIFGLFFAGTAWAVPRAADSGLIELPKATWGVKLGPSP